MIDSELLVVQESADQTLPNVHRHRFSAVRSVFLFCFIIHILTIPGLASSQVTASRRIEVVNQGFNMTLLMNSHGAMGLTAIVGREPRLGSSYPAYLLNEHIHTLEILIGAIKDTSTRFGPKFAKIVTTTGEDNINGVDTVFGETYPVNLTKQFFTTSTLNTDEPNKRGVDDDGDGLIDEDPLDGIDNDGDGKIDEDYGAISESDVYSEYTDTARIPGLTYYHPLDVLIRQSSFAWARNIREPILPVDFEVKNIGNKVLRGVYIGVLLDPIWSASATTYNNMLSGYWPDVVTAHVNDPVEKDQTPIGVSILSLPKPLGKIQFNFLWDYSSILRNPDVWFCSDDPCLYDLMTGAPYLGLWGPIRPDQMGTDPAHTTLLFSFGPIDTLSPGDSLKFSMAVVSGSQLDYGIDNMHDNARIAQTLFQRRYYPFVILPSPKLTIESGYRRVTLRWGSSDSANNPMEVWDDENAIASYYPPDHWRRINPPTGHNRGGRVFEGYRLYRSEDPAGAPNSFTLLRQWDVIDSVGPKFGVGNGIETTFVDSGIQIGKTYWYSVTSFGIPDIHTIDYVDFGGTIKRETLNTKSAESSVVASRKRVNIPFAVSNKVGEVKVVPNPYRTDENYTFESGGWEGRGAAWNEYKRLIKFIHLPSSCTIRIYSLAGEVIATIHHDDPIRGEENWNLLSESNRAIASGVYIYSVESSLGTQVGKFVVIR